MKAEPIKDVIKSVIKGWDSESLRFNQEEIAKIWRKIAGRRLAEHSKPTSFRSARLIVNVDSSAWLYELAMHRPQILKKLKQAFKKRPVEELQLRIGEI